MVLIPSYVLTPAEYACLMVFFSIYAILGQFYVFGLQNSIISFVAATISPAKRIQFCADSLFVCLFTSFFATVLLFVFREPVTVFINNTYFNRIFFALPLALPFFAANKILISFLNAYGFVSISAFASSLRPFSLLLLFFISLNTSRNLTAFVFSLPVSEFIVFLFCFAFCTLRLAFIRYIRIPSCSSFFLLFTHGLRSFLNPFLYEMNSRADTLILSNLTNPQIVSLYTPLSTIVQSLFIVLFLFRSYFLPSLVSANFSRTPWSSMFSFFNRTFYIPLLIAISLSICSFLAYIVLVPFLLPELFSAGSILPLLLLLTATILVSWFIPYDTLLLVLNRPLIYTFVSVFGFILNLSASYLLIPRYNLLGSSLSFSISLLGSTLLYLLVLFCLYSTHKLHTPQCLES